MLIVVREMRSLFRRVSSFNRKPEACACSGAHASGLRLNEAKVALT